MATFTMRNAANSVDEHYFCTGTGTLADPYKITIQPADSGLELSKKNVVGHTVGTVFGHNQDLDPAAAAAIWDYGVDQPVEVLLTADTELFLSSTSAADIATTVIIVGLTDDYNVKTLVHPFTGGLSQESIGLWYRIDKITIIGGTALVGNLYCAEADTLTLGVPDTSTGVHAFIHDGLGTTHKASGTVPAGHTMYINRLFLGVRRGEDCVFVFMVKTPTMPDFIEASDFPVYQNSGFFTFDPPFPIEEKTDFFLLGTTLTNNTQASANFGFTLVDNSVAP